MSKNYELLQQAEFGLAVTPIVATGERTTSPAVATSTAEDLSGLDPAVREEAQKLVQRLFIVPGKTAPKAVLFAGVDAGDDCGLLSAVIAKVLAKSVPGTVCLVEGNLRSPLLPGALGVNCDRGLMDSLRQNGSIKEYLTRTGVDRFWLLSAGSPVQDTVTLLNSDRMRERVSELRQEFDYVVMTAPPLNNFADGVVLGRLLDGVVLVVEANSTRRESALRVTESLRATKISVLGAVLNNRTFPIPEALYKRL